MPKCHKQLIAIFYSTTSASHMYIHATSTLTDWTSTLSNTLSDVTCKLHSESNNPTCPQLWRCSNHQQNMKWDYIAWWYKYKYHHKFKFEWIVPRRGRMQYVLTIWLHSSLRVCMLQISQTWATQLWSWLAERIMHTNLNARMPDCIWRTLQMDRPCS